jgi:hypothetical protein
MKKTLSNNKGIALVTSLMLTLITMGIVMGLFYVLTQSIKSSAATKRYRNATEAAYGGSELMAFDIIGNAWKNFSSAGGVSNTLVGMYGNVNLAVVASNACLTQKLSSPAANWSNCSALQKSLDLTTIKSSPDLTFLLKGTTSGQHYKVFAKIVDTSSGNTDTAGSSMLNANDSAGLLSASGSAYNKFGGGSVPIQHIPYSYRIDVQGEKELNSMEKSNVTVLYAY